ncbi:MAG: hypothetical protein AAF411_05190 [Myxococcota bacterium]
MVLSARTLRIIETLFPEEEREAVAELLLTECSNTVAGCRDWRKPGLERLWISVLKLSDGDADKLLSAIDLARLDYRDLFMAAGFGHDTDAHLRWEPTTTAQGSVGGLCRLLKRLTAHRRM